MKSKTIVKSDGVQFDDNLTVGSNTDVLFELDKENNLLNLKIRIFSRTDADHSTDISLFGVSSKGIRNLKNQLQRVEDKLSELGF